MKTETIVGALIAAVIGLLTGFLALLMQDGVNSISDISQIPWIVLVVGATISFLKDFQALTTRRIIGKITGGTVDT